MYIKIFGDIFFNFNVIGFVFYIFVYLIVIKIWSDGLLYICKIV